MNRHTKLFRAVRQAGWRIERTRNGWRLWPPSPARPIAVHGTESDVRANRNTRARLRRAGLNLAVGDVQ